MITFTILSIILLALLFVSALVLLAGGTVITVLFGDLIVCGLIIWIIVKLFKQRK